MTKCLDCATFHAADAGVAAEAIAAPARETNEKRIEPPSSAGRRMAALARLSSEFLKLLLRGFAAALFAAINQVIWACAASGRTRVGDRRRLRRPMFSQLPVRLPQANGARERRYDIGLPFAGSSRDWRCEVMLAGAIVSF